MIDETFSEHLGELHSIINANWMYFAICLSLFAVEKFVLVWRATKDDIMDDIMTLKVPPNCREFREYYDEVQDKISKISFLDELLEGKF